LPRGLSTCLGHQDRLSCFWRANGITSMLASVLGMALSIQFGIAKTYALGACFYVVCAIVMVASRRANSVVVSPAEPVTSPALVPLDAQPHEWPAEKADLKV